MIKGITIQLVNKVDTGNVDELNHAIYFEQYVTVNNVLVAPSSGPEIIDSVNLYGKKALYTLAFQKTWHYRVRSIAAHESTERSRPGLWRTVWISYSLSPESGSA